MCASNAQTHHNFSPVLLGLELWKGLFYITDTQHTKNLPFGRNAAEITKTERKIARDPLPVIAMLDTCLRLAALNHLETAMG